MSRCTMLSAVVAALAVPVGFADEGRIPVFQPTTITQPGAYVLTEDVSFASSDAIVIQASNVTLDLNGRTIVNTDGIGSHVVIDGDRENIRIRNGRLQGGQWGVYYSSGTFSTTVWLEGLEISGVAADAVYLAGLRYFEMTSSKVRNTGNGGVLLIGNTSFAGRIVGNEFRDIGNRAMIVAGGEGVVIRENVVSAASYGVDTGIGGGGVVVEGNSFAGTSIGVTLAAPGCLVLNNAFRGFTTGIVVGFSANGHRIAGNVIQGGSGDGVSVSTLRNLIEGNQIEGKAGCGIRFTGTPPASDNVYRNNMLRGNSGGALCGNVAGNTDGGGNIP